MLALIQEAAPRDDNRGHRRRSNYNALQASIVSALEGLSSGRYTFSKTLDEELATTARAASLAEAPTG